MPLILKPATFADIPLLIAIEKTVTGARTYSSMIIAEEWHDAFKTDQIYLIEKDRDIVGNISYQQKSPSHVYINGFVVMPAFQGKGIGRETLTQLLEQLDTMQRIDLVTHPDNHNAIHLYESFGFIIESKKDNYFGDGEPRLVLAKVT